MKIIACLCLCLTCISAHAIVAVGNLSLNGKNLGLKSQIGIDFSGSSGNTDKSDREISADWVWKATDHISHVILSYEYGESNQQTNTNNTFVHARHIRHYNDSFNLEYFAQAEQDKFARLNSRKLMGGGTRFATKNNSFFGIGIFYFEERLDKETNANANANDNDNDKLQDQGMRFNAYLSSDYTYDDRTILTARIYAQPRAGELEDLRVLLNASIRFSITQHTSIRISLKSTHDSRPATGVDRTNTAYTSGFEYTF